jgi:sterol desaturase/sphingolipid hydroxylase (fatty acid hydroxylase superfamily)
MDISSELIRYALPTLVIVALVEAFVLARLADTPYPWRETMGSLGVALGQKIKQILIGGLVVSFFAALWSYRLLTVPLDRWWGIALLFLAVEFAYYWQHRLSHEIRWFWATHAVHHSANHLNFAAALRLGWTGELSGHFLFFAPLVLIGLHPLAVAAALGFNLVYQFWIHSEWVPKLGVLEWILNTPSNHRVHHASNPDYLDRNYGGVLIVFDRLFGTYTQERDTEPCRYGLVDRLDSVNPVTIALHEWAALARDLRRARTWSERWMYLFGPPGWHPPEPVEAPSRRLDPAVTQTATQHSEETIPCASQ